MLYRFKDCFREQDIYAVEEKITKYKRPLKTYYSEQLTMYLYASIISQDHIFLNKRNGILN